MSAHVRNSILKGFIAGTICWLVLSPLVFRFFGAGAPKGGASGLLAEAGPILLFVGFLCIFAATVLGYVGGIVTVKRRLKMVLGGLAVYWFDALLVSIWLLFFSNDAASGEGFWTRVGGALMLSLIGSLLYGIVLVPFVLIASLLLEKWTRRAEA